MPVMMDAPKSLGDEAVLHDDLPAMINQTAKQKSKAVAEVKKTFADANAELTEVGRENQNAAGQAAAEVQAEQASQIDDEERRFWATIAVKGKMADCGRDIRQAEARIEKLKAEIKEEKEFLKGEQIRLTRLAGELADIIDGHPLPKDPNAKPEPEQPDQGGDAESEGSDGNAPNWRVMETGQLLDGMKGLGAKKLEALCDAAPTAGDLEDLRGEASRAHLSFKDKLPAGFGQKIADAIEDRLIEHVAKCTPSAEEQAAAEREDGQDDEAPFDDDEADEPNAIAGKIADREREQLAEAAQQDEPADDQYEDVDEDDIP